MNTSQFLSSRQTKTDGTLPVPGDSVEKKNWKYSHCRITLYRKTCLLFLLIANINKIWEQLI